LLEVGTGFHPELTGRENIFLNGAILGMGRAEIKKKFDEIVDFAEIEKFLDTPVKRYSSGMYVRLAFAVAAHLEPEILIVDEVLAVGDAQFQKKCLGKMEDVSAKDGLTLLIVSHNIPIINNLCQRVLLIHKGMMIKSGSPNEVIEYYLDSSNKKINSKFVWENIESAPGNDIVRLHSVTIIQNDRECSDSYVNIDSEVIVKISYWNIRENSKIYTALWLKDKAGIEVLSSANARYVCQKCDEWGEKAHPKGLFHSYCTFPSDFFNEGLYYITAIVGLEPANTQILEKDIVSFEVIDTGDMRKNYLGGWLGVVRPKLLWHTVSDTKII
jgi:lipopolysaccharide transport system ATP-binding protein